MSPDFLSTREPLRVLYTGNPAVRMDIIYKISSAICASESHLESDKTVNQNSDGVFNIFPISAFGSSSMPDVHLLESSGRQIRVEDCTSAEEIIIEGGAFPGDTVYSLTVDNDKTYRSLFSPSGSVIQPKWPTLPHIAIFFCTEDDDAHTRNTRTNAWGFMNRHGVPSIFISNNQCFTEPPTGRWKNFVDQHAVHLCLESRDPERPHFSQRLPIDLTSFLNIDARQMNRNLTYLTGLAASPDPGLSEDAVTPPAMVGRKGHIEDFFPEAFSFVCTAGRSAREYAQQHRWIMPLGVALITAFVGVMMSVLASTSLVSPHQAVAVSMSPAGLVPTVSSVTPTRAAPTPTTTVVVNVTSTKTVKVINQQASASTLASALSFAGFLSDKPSSSPPESETKKSICSAEQYGNNEILIKLPSGRKASWLARGVIDIDVYRGDEPIKTKLSSIDEGIVVEINKNDAHGVLTLSVVTTKKPKINETFEVNFGRPVAMEVFEAGMRILQDLAGEVANSAHCASGYLSGLTEVVENIREDTTTMIGRIKGAGQAVQSYSRTLREQTFTRAKKTLNSDKISLLLTDAQNQVMRQFASSDDVREELDLAVLRAQIASKVWWLKVQGKAEESAQYERNATRLLKAKHELAKARKARSQGSPREESGRCKGWRRCGSTRREHRGGRWKKMIPG